MGKFRRVCAEHNRNRMTGNGDGITHHPMQHGSTAEFDELLGLSESRRRTGGKDNDMQTLRRFAHDKDRRRKEWRF